MKYIQAINERFSTLNKLIFEGDVSEFAGEEFSSHQLNIVMPPTQQNSVIEQNPFQI